MPIATRHSDNVYDKRGYKTEERRPTEEFTTFEYDGNGNLIKKTDTKGQAITYDYDEANRMKLITYPAAGTTPARAITYGYDFNGNLKSYSDGTSTGGYNYDVLNRKTDESVSHTGGPTFTSAYTYYGNGQKKSFTGPDGVTINYTYDAGNRLQTITTPAGALVYNSYNWTATHQGDAARW